MKTEMKVISYNKTGGAEIVIVTTGPDGKKTSLTKHFSKQEIADLS